MMVSQVAAEPVTLISEGIKNAGSLSRVSSVKEPAVR